MKRSWTAGLTDASKKAEITAQFEGSSLMRQRLKELIQKKQETARVASLSKEDYKDANWAFKQADSIGYQRAMEEIMDILN